MHSSFCVVLSQNVLPGARSSGKNPHLRKRSAYSVRGNAGLPSAAVIAARRTCVTDVGSTKQRRAHRPAWAGFRSPGVTAHGGFARSVRQGAPRSVLCAKIKNAGRTCVFMYAKRIILLLLRIRLCFLQRSF